MTPDDAPLRIATERYSFRRSLSTRELLPAVGVAVGTAIGAGLLAFYIARLVLQREPLALPRSDRERLEG